MRPFTPMLMLAALAAFSACAWQLAAAAEAASEASEATSDLHRDLAALAQRDDGGPAPFDEDQLGFDKHADIFYYSDKAVNKAFERKDYLATRVTLAGQKADATLRAVPEASHPFAVGQRSFKQFGTLMDRWDVKDEAGRGVQYFALYHGQGNAYVVNKVRAHLLRTLANAVGAHLPSLERIAEEAGGASDEDRVVQTVIDSVRATIERVFREVDGVVRKTMADSDDSSACATIAVVSRTHVITALVGEGKVIAYGADFETHNLTPFGDDAKVHNVFGVKKSRKDFIHPHVEVFERDDERGYQFLLLESPALAKTIDDESATRIVTSQIDQHKYVESEEQEIYTGALVRILNLVESSLHPLKRFLFHSDYSAILVGLNTDYQEIH